MQPTVPTSVKKKASRPLGAAALVVAALVATGSLGADGATERPAGVEPVQPLPAECGVIGDWRARMSEKYPPGTWAPVPVEATDSDLAAMGLPSGDVLAARRYPVPTAFYPDGTTREVSIDLLAPTVTPPPSVVLPTASTPVMSYAGSGCLGIRPGAFVIFISGNFPLGGWSISLCSLAHVLGSPGSYDIATAGHCAKGGQIATVVGVLGSKIPVLLDFGKVAKSVDGGIGNDYAIIDIYPKAQGITTPNMCFWGGPFLGAFTPTGSVVSFQYSRNSLVPTIGVNPNPNLAHVIVHYGHGLGVGAGGTPRAGVATTWTSSYFTF
ncbi:MAG: hypothetical protein ACRDH5_19365, partial [bacterium]